MGFKEIFKDDNSWNEKSIIGFIAFMVMIIIIIADLISGFFEIDLKIEEYIYNSFLFLVLGSFGISGIEKIFVKKTNQNE